MTDRCTCGDPMCPSCGSAQDTYEPGWTEELQEQRDRKAAEHFRDWMSADIVQHLTDAREAGHDNWTHAAALLVAGQTDRGDLLEDLERAAMTDLYEYALEWMRSGRALPSDYPRID